MFSEFIPIPNYMKLISELKGIKRRIQISNNQLILINTATDIAHITDHDPKHTTCPIQLSQHNHLRQLI